MTALPTLGLYVFAALVEIVGCFALWAWLRLECSPRWLVQGMMALAAFARALTRVDADFAGRSHAAYRSVRHCIGIGLPKASAPTAGI